MSDGRILHFFGGKGGSGKTTLAAAFALNLAGKHPRDKVLLLSADPTRGLSDLLKKKLSAKPIKLVAGRGTGGLYAAEFEPAAYKLEIQEFGLALRQAVIKGSILSEDDLQKMLEHGSEGMEELLQLFRVTELLEAGTFQRVVVDAPSSAHSLRLFDLTTHLRKLLALMRSGDKALRARKDASALEQLTGRLEKLQGLLKDPARTAFHLVSLAEPVSEVQSRILFGQLRERGIPVEELLLNQVEDHGGCQACQGRRGLQAPHVRKLQLLGSPIQLIAKREVAPRGLEGLKLLAREWATGKDTQTLEFSAAEGPPALVRAPSMPPIAAPPLPPTRLIFFVGQGGVGKSSCAAAAAVTLTEKEGPVLLISVDPSHSLSDVLQSRLTDTESQVKGTKGLYARELDTANWFAVLKKRIKEKTDRVFGDVKGIESPFDREILRNLLEGAPAVLDDLPALTALSEALLQERFKRIVVDPLPVGAAVRLLELPDAARGWLTDVLTVLTKYRAKGLGDLADEVALHLKHVKRFEDALATPTESRFVVVTRGEDLATARTERLVAYLQKRSLAVERVLVNRVLPKSVCEKCENRRTDELNAAKHIEKRLGLPVTVAPALGRHPAGLRELKAFRTSWYALSAAPAKIKAA